MGGNRVSVPRHIFNMFIVWALTGFWHGANWTFIMWGLFFFVFLILEKYLIKPKKDPKIMWRIPRIILTQIIIFFSFIIFKFTDLSSLISVLTGIFTSNGKGFTDPQTSTLFINNVFFIAVSILACTPIVPAIGKIADRTDVTARIKAVAGAVIPTVLLILSAFALAGDSYNPFLYFQF